ncbi:hypothetical protein [Aquimarina muelleri]|uniref:Uncharacterized protein n=1 Tax=Aquimarina muelleri TaxID=279356 RepID=A0A918N3R5_9FLAO|nr:hypothetical protein [Aquimarina muelleri]MCX2761436.1 hypothetical protein [Aquimarina muelleri]GGX13687.1 hypothetical protein GCM10007384_14090 [Aquimarina muelleri]
MKRLKHCFSKHFLVLFILFPFITGNSLSLQNDQEHAILNSQAHFGKIESTGNFATVHELLSIEKQLFFSKTEIETETEEEIHFPACFNLTSLYSWLPYNSLVTKKRIYRFIPKAQRVPLYDLYCSRKDHLS